MNNDLTARLVVTLCATYCRSSMSLNGRLLKPMNRPTGSRDALQNLDRKPADAEAAGNTPAKTPAVLSDGRSLSK
jgi:hypothetical protein